MADGEPGILGGRVPGCVSPPYRPHAAGIDARARRWFGIYKKSRVCAVLMLGYFAFAKFVLISEGHVGASSLFMSLVFFYFYVQGVIGTFAYHKHLRQAVP
ncbi:MULTISPECIES: hypothetical protein [Variovorax]|uniref:hypothetical protein n=1 Tax=Variovorax TaxID=34072 RepID=UPI001AC8C294|nr:MULTISPECIES: hypothetical protein [Variovorax]MBN8756444.1 hypothetical protein [Variovorax sp.]UKI06419.1 hypothetical protein L3V85_26885 [Variovorax paradoxus]